MTIVAIIAIMVAAIATSGQDNPSQSGEGDAISKHLFVGFSTLRVEDVLAIDGKTSESKGAFAVLLRSGETFDSTVGKLSKELQGFVVTTRPNHVMMSGSIGNSRVTLQVVKATPDEESIENVKSTDSTEFVVKVLITYRTGARTE
ncbi:MAG: hypothetical protein WD716_13825 [Fimbriimonadaceae bacterium]